ncbi:PQQ-binding-like beta-propeller repeat protein [Haloplanus halobius]|uniref:PQQ-binding-like beta-propeller repeat protein n=1 Tax=Haloplanus halobius TaxID=2934938 RepID=UPI00200DD0CD|nr:PQQ-binding-like beta-propeller repeat protein [Haloplanus sp. XH21]
MPRQTFTRRRWLAAIVGGVTAGCGGRSATADATSSPRAATTEPPVTTTASSDPVGAQDANPSFEQGSGACSLGAASIADGTWPMTHRDPSGTNAAPAVNGPTAFPLNERWTMSALDAQVTFPVADDQFVYLVAADADADPSVPQSAVLCHDPRLTGEIQWRHRIDATPIGPPVVAGSAVYVPFGTQDDARIVAIDRAEGSLVTTYDLPGRFVGELASAGPSLMIPTQQAYRVVDARTGDHCWSFTPNRVREADRRDRNIRAAAVGDGVAYVGTGYPDGDQATESGHLYAVDPSVGGVRWQASLDGPVGRLAVSDGVVVATTGHGLVGFGAETGERRWSAPAEAGVRPATLAVADGTAVYGTRRTLHGLDTASGTERWSLPFGVHGDVIFVGDVLFGVGRSDPTTNRLSLAAVDAASGTQRWRQEIYDPIVDVMAANGYLYAITTDGSLFAFGSV